MSELAIRCHRGRVAVSGSILASGQDMLGGVAVVAPHSHGYGYSCGAGGTASTVRQAMTPVHRAGFIFVPLDRNPAHLWPGAWKPIAKRRSLSGSHRYELVIGVFDDESIVRECCRTQPASLKHAMHECRSAG